MSPQQEGKLNFLCMPKKSSDFYADLASVSLLACQAAAAHLSVIAHVPLGLTLALILVRRRIPSTNVTITARPRTTLGVFGDALL